jgi:hypothetical protein
VKLILCIFAVSLVACNRTVSELSFDSTPAPGIVVSGQTGSGLKNMGLAATPGNPIEISLEKTNLSSRSGSITAWFKVNLAPDDGNSCSLAKISFKNRNESLALFSDKSRLALRMNMPDSKFCFDCNLPPLFLLENNWFFAVLQWNFDAPKPEDFLSLSVNGFDQGAFYTLNDQKTSDSPQISENLIPDKFSIETDNSMRRIASIAIDELRFSSHPDTLENIKKKCSDAMRPEKKPVVYSGSELKHFIGTDIPDVKSSSGRAWTSDPRLIQIGPVELDAGSYSFRIHAKSGMQLDDKILLASLIVKEASSERQIASQNLTTKNFENAARYEWLEAPFELKSPAAISAALKMEAFGYHDFFVDRAEIVSPKGFQKEFAIDQMDHFLGCTISEADAADGIAWTNAHALCYGPYQSLPAIGKYIATFRLKAHGTSSENNLATLEVYAHDGYLNGSRQNKSYGIMGVNNSSFKQFDEYLDFSIPFFYDGAKLMEYRILVYQVQENALTLDRITVDLIEP